MAFVSIQKPKQTTAFKPWLTRRFFDLRTQFVKGKIEGFEREFREGFAPLGISGEEMGRYILNGGINVTSLPLDGNHMRFHIGDNISQIVNEVIPVRMNGFKEFLS